jgi:hypothetical protein
MSNTRLDKVLSGITWCFLASIVALVVGLFIILIPIEILQLTAAKGFEVFYFRFFGVLASVTLPGAVTHFIIWDSQNSKRGKN